MYEILSNLPESVAYTCINCTEQHPAEWRLALEKELQVSLKQVLTALLNSRTTSHLLRYRQVSWGLAAPWPGLAQSIAWHSTGLWSCRRSSRRGVFVVRRATCTVIVVFVHSYRNKQWVSVRQLARLKEKNRVKFSGDGRI